MVEVDINAVPQVIACSRRPRATLLQLMQIADGMSDTAMDVMTYAAYSYAGKYPRFPVKLSIEPGGMNRSVLNLLHIAELVSDDGIKEMIGTASSLSDEYPRFPRRNAEILSITKR